MVQSLQLGAPADHGQQQIRRVNRLPVVIAIALIVIFGGVVIFGLSWRGLPFDRSNALDGGSGMPATSFGEQLKRGVSDGIIGEPEQVSLQPAPQSVAPQPLKPVEVPAAAPRQPSVDLRPQLADSEWKARLKREQDEQYLREAQRQRMARLQARATAMDAPLNVDIADAGSGMSARDDKIAGLQGKSAVGDLYSAALKAGMAGQAGDPNSQTAKEDFFNEDLKEVGYLTNRVVPPLSPYELKRGSVIPATLISGLNSDLPGRLIGQVSQDVYDSATSERLLIPQGAKLFGRYDSKVSFGQQRALVVWTDLIFPDGATLRLDAMAGTDAEGYGGFSDKVDRHLLQTFGSAALVAMIGTGIDASMPESSVRSTQDTASDAARRNFAETFGRVAEQTISKNLNVQPTIRIRPGYQFNILVDQDIVFPSSYAQRS